MVFNDTSSTLALLLSRRSGKARDLGAPGPSDAEWQALCQAGVRVPDHGKLAPWRLVDIPTAARGDLANVIETAYRAEKPGAAQLEVDAVRAYALQGPRLLAVLFCPKHASSIPVWEQSLSVGAVCQTLMIAAHAQGYCANWLTGWPAYAPAVRAALGGGADDQIAGFIYVGTPTRPLDERPRPVWHDVVKVYGG